MCMVDVAILYVYKAYVYFRIRSELLEQTWHIHIHVTYKWSVQTGYVGISFYVICMCYVKGSSQHKVGGEWFEIKLGNFSRMLVKYEVLPIPNVIFVC